MDIDPWLDRLLVLQGKGIEVMHRDVVVLADPSCDLVVALGVFRVAVRSDAALGDWCGGRED